MNPLAIARFIAQLVADLLGSSTTPEQAAKRLLEAAVATGIPSTVLASYLSEAGKRRADIAADIAQAVKMARK